METHADEPTSAEVDEREDGRGVRDSESEAEAVAEVAEAGETTETAATAEPEESVAERAVAEEEAPPRDYIPARRGRGGFDPEADAIARAARYSFRQRAVLGLVLGAIFFAALALVVSSELWWVCAIAVIGLVSYLSYLRRQVRMEEEIRRRRMARLGRARLGVESSSDDELDLVPARLRRAGAVVLESDDEDPVFEHLPHHDVVTASRPVGRREAAQMRTAAGQ